MRPLPKYIPPQRSLSFICIYLRDKSVIIGKLGLTVTLVFWEACHCGDTNPFILTANRHVTMFIISLRSQDLSRLITNSKLDYSNIFHIFPQSEPNL
jgi:hypothetical protein